MLNYKYFLKHFYFLLNLVKGLEKAKIKFQRCFFDWEHAEQEYTKAESSTDMSRNQVLEQRVAQICLETRY